MATDTRKVKTYLQHRNNYYNILVRWYEEGARRQASVSTGLRTDGHNKRKAEAIQREVQKEYEEKVAHRRNDMLFSDYLKSWLPTRSHKIKDSTYYEYQKQINRIIGPWFDDRKIKLCDLSTKDIEAFYTHKMDDDRIKPSTIHRYHSTINKALRYAVKHGLLNYNPGEAVELPQVVPHVADFYSADELNKLLEMVTGTDLETVVYLAAWFGLRRGEIIGLRWSAIDFDNRTLSIVGVMKDKGKSGSQKTKDMYYYPLPKTKTSVRSFPLGDDAISYLRKIKAEQDKQKKLRTYNHQWDDFVCVWPTGDIIPLEHVTRKFPKLCVKCGLRRLRLHELRHTNASLLLAHGTSMKETQEWLGHSSYNITANTYAHVPSTAKERQMKTLESILHKTNC